MVLVTCLKSKLDEGDRQLINLEKATCPKCYHPHPTLFQKGYDREIVTSKRKAPMERLPVQPIRSKKKKSDTDSKQREKKEAINIMDTPTEN